jgi:hypothetical protein
MGTWISENTWAVAAFFLLVLTYQLRKFIGPEATKDFRKALWYRYTGQDYKQQKADEERAIPISVQDADRAIAYIDRVMDRQLCILGLPDRGCLLDCRPVL